MWLIKEPSSRQGGGSTGSCFMAGGLTAAVTSLLGQDTEMPKC